MPSVLFAAILWSLQPMSGVELHERLERLLVVARVMYVAAHPDDENTQLLAYLVHDQRARTAYLSITRGDGGQNLVGDEQSELLGVIRTSELLAARRVDGAEQMFTRALDFGYSKRSDEALAIWGKEATLGDVVWAMRRFRPQVVITRFPEEGPTHGHHLASAILAREAFAAAGDEKRFPEQLDRVKPWRPERLLFNVPNRFMKDLERPDDLVVDIGGFDPERGLSYGEIAAESRSMHKSQGFGAPRRWGPAPERFRFLAGSRPEKGLLDGIDTSWRSVPGGAALQAALEDALAKFRLDAPVASLDALAKAWRAAESVEDAELRGWVRRELETAMLGASGLLLEARAERDAATPGETLPVKVHLAVRGDTKAVKLAKIDGDAQDRALSPHERVEIDRSIATPKDASPSVLPWLAEPHGEGRYVGPGDPDRPLPPPPIATDVELEVAGVPIRVGVPVQRVWTDPVAGERRRDVEVLPPITVTADGDAIVVPDGKSATLHVDVRVRGQGGRVRFEAPDGFRVEPASVEVEASRGVDLRVERTAADAQKGTLRIVAESGGRTWSLAERAIDHAHVPLRTVLLPASVRVGTVSIDVPPGKIGYVPGPGDRVASSLRRAGFDVRDVDDETLAKGDLDVYAAILVGIRAANARPIVRDNLKRLQAFAERGGTVVVQYTTVPRDAPPIELGPYPLTLDHDRVSDETARVDFLAPDHDVLRRPNAIAASDFDGWVQERGLYFGRKWDERWVPVLAMADPGETPSKGALLVADVGKGRFVYTGLSFFRQLPAGVPGAYRLMANLLARRDAGETKHRGASEPPPILGRWGNLYAVVAGALVVLVALFWALTRRYRP